MKEQNGVTWKLVNSRTRRILPAIIETELLSPHLLLGGILHTWHLYPMLDNCDDVINVVSRHLRGSDTIKQGIPDSSTAAVGNSSSKDTGKTIIPDFLRSDEKMFAASMHSVLEDVCNGSTLSDGGDGGSRISELLAKHVDGRFKDAKAHTTPSVSSFMLMLSADANVVTDPSEVFQNDVMALFCHVHSKDVFEAFYKPDFAKRLLTG
ncbi:LOW QUALITY PROTEIN: hypothetical protein ACHAWX_005389 [Stephanocyclus meneghinianus]